KELDVTFRSVIPIIDVMTITNTVPKRVNPELFVYNDFLLPRLFTLFPPSNHYFRLNRLLWTLNDNYHRLISVFIIFHLNVKPIYICCYCSVFLIDNGTIARIVDKLRSI